MSGMFDEAGYNLPSASGDSMKMGFSPYESPTDTRLDAAGLRLSFKESRSIINGITALIAETWQHLWKEALATMSQLYELRTRIGLS